MPTAKLAIGTGSVIAFYDATGHIIEMVSYPHYNGGTLGGNWGYQTYGLSRNGDRIAISDADSYAWFFLHDTLELLQNYEPSEPHNWSIGGTFVLPDAIWMFSWNSTESPSGPSWVDHYDRNTGAHTGREVITFGAGGSDNIASYDVVSWDKETFYFWNNDQENPDVWRWQSGTPAVYLGNIATQLQGPRGSLVTGDVRGMAMHGPDKIAFTAYCQDVATRLHEHTAVVVLNASDLSVANRYEIGDLISAGTLAAFGSAALGTNAGHYLFGIDSDGTDIYAAEYENGSGIYRIHTPTGAISLWSAEDIIQTDTGPTGDIVHYTPNTTLTTTTIGRQGGLSVNVRDFDGFNVHILPDQQWRVWPRFIIPEPVIDPDAHFVLLYALENDNLFWQASPPAYAADNPLKAPWIMGIAWQRMDALRDAFTTEAPGVLNLDHIEVLNVANQPPTADHTLVSFEPFPLSDLAMDTAGHAAMFIENDCDLQSGFGDMTGHSSPITSPPSWELPVEYRKPVRFGRGVGALFSPTTAAVNTRGPSLGYPMVYSASWRRPGQIVISEQNDGAFVGSRVVQFKVYDLVGNLLNTYGPYPIDRGIDGQLVEVMRNSEMIDNTHVFAAVRDASLSGNRICILDITNGDVVTELPGLNVDANSGTVGIWFRDASTVVTLQSSGGPQTLVEYDVPSQTITRTITMPGLLPPQPDAHANFDGGIRYAVPDVTDRRYAYLTRFWEPYSGFERTSTPPYYPHLSGSYYNNIAMNKIVTTVYRVDLDSGTAVQVAWLEAPTDYVRTERLGTPTENNVNFRYMTPYGATWAHTIDLNPSYTNSVFPVGGRVRYERR